MKHMGLACKAKGWKLFFVGAALYVLLAGWFWLDDHYAVLVKYHDEEAVADVFRSAGVCLEEQLGLFDEMESIVDAMAHEDDGSMFYTYAECLKTDRYYMEKLVEAMYQSCSGLVMGNMFEWSVSAFDDRLCKLFAQRSLERSHFYETYMREFEEILCDSTLTRMYMQGYRDRLKAVMEADKAVSSAVYQLVVRELYSSMQLQRGDFSEEDASFDCLSQEQNRELFMLLEGNLRERQIEHLYALWNAEYELKAYSQQIAPQIAARHGLQEGDAQ